MSGREFQQQHQRNVHHHVMCVLLHALLMWCGTWSCLYRQRHIRPLFALLPSFDKYFLLVSDLVSAACCPRGVPAFAAPTQGCKALHQ